MKNKSLKKMVKHVRMLNDLMDEFELRQQEIDVLMEYQTQVSELLDYIAEVEDMDKINQVPLLDKVNILYYHFNHKGTKHDQTHRS